MPANLSNETEHLLVDLMQAEGAIKRARERLVGRQEEIAKSLSDRYRHVPVSEEAAVRKAAAEELVTLYRGRYRSEIAALAADIVTAERRRARILRELDAYPAFGESVPAVDIAVEHDGERAFTIKTGCGRNFSFNLPVPIYRELWRGDGRYSRADMVTHDGSLWIAVADAPAHEPGKGAEWRLAAMRGKNGKDTKQSFRSAT